MAGSESVMVKKQFMNNYMLLKNHNLPDNSITVVILLFVCGLHGILILKL